MRICVDIDVSISRHVPRRLIGDLGYQCYFDFQPYFHANNFRRERFNYFVIRGMPQMSTNILCVHPERMVLSGLEQRQIQLA